MLCTFHLSIIFLGIQIFKTQFSLNVFGDSNTIRIFPSVRNFEAVKLMAAEDKRKQEEIAAEEANNPMAVLENRTKDSRREMEIMENLEELKERADTNAQTDLNDLIGNSLEKQQKLLAQILLKQEVSKSSVKVRSYSPCRC